MLWLSMLCGRDEGMIFARLQSEFQSKGWLVDVEIETLSV